jgi:hypothetical protein
LGLELCPPAGLSIYGGLTFTGAWGYILQWDEHFQDFRYDTGVFGVGPIFLLRLEPLRIGGFSAGVELLGGIVVYTKGFPPGGDIYNFTFRMGVLLGYRISKSLKLEAGVRWMHVSNGQGLGPFNPSYEGLGFLTGVQFDL